MLALSRTASVIGRILLLTNSIKTIKGIKGYGVLVGTRWDRKLFKGIINHPSITDTQTISDKEKFRLGALVGVKT